jgi:hypothetical protein
MRSQARALPMLAVLFSLAAATPAQAPPAPPLLDSLGSYHRAITTASPQAQRYFDQGLRLLFAFALEEAQLSFEAAARLDPACASCWWGVAMSLGPHINVPGMPDRTLAAHRAIAKALALAPGATAVEQALIAAAAKRSADPAPTDKAGQAALDQAYAGAMREVTRRFPGDLRQGSVLDCWIALASLPPAASLRFAGWCKIGPRFWLRR